MQLPLTYFNDDQYPEGFFYWLRNNQHLYDEFERRALQMARVRSRYSARTIVEVMRWNTDLRQGPDIVFKISNNMIPGMARLWMQQHGRKYPRFFSLREN